MFECLWSTNMYNLPPSLFPFDLFLSAVCNSKHCNLRMLSSKQEESFGMKTLPQSGRNIRDAVTSCTLIPSEFFASSSKFDWPCYRLCYRFPSLLTSPGQRSGWFDERTNFWVSRRRVSFLLWRICSPGERQTHFAIHLFRRPGIPAVYAAIWTSAVDDERPHEERHIAITIECSTEIEILTGHRRAAERTGPTVAQTPRARIRPYVMRRRYVSNTSRTNNLFSMMRIVYL